MNSNANVEAKTPAEAETSGGEGIWCAEGDEAQTKWSWRVRMASSQGRMRDCETQSRDRDRECRIRTANAEFDWNGSARLGSERGRPDGEDRGMARRVRVAVSAGDEETIG